MSVVKKTTRMPKKTPTSNTKSKVQRFVRLNLDDTLESFIQSYESKYKLLNRGDIVRMLLSEVYYKHQQDSKTKLIELLQSLPKPKGNHSEEEVFKILEENDLM
jgi:hypothetical protein